MDPLQLVLITPPALTAVGKGDEHLLESLYQLLLLLIIGFLVLVDRLEVVVVTLVDHLLGVLEVLPEAVLKLGRHGSHLLPLVEETLHLAEGLDRIRLLAECSRLADDLLLLSAVVGVVLDPLSLADLLLLIETVEETGVLVHQGVAIVVGDTTDLAPRVTDIEEFVAKGDRIHRIGGAEELSQSLDQLSLGGKIGLPLRPFLLALLASELLCAGLEVDEADRCLVLRGRLCLGTLLSGRRRGDTALRHHLALETAHIALCRDGTTLDHGIDRLIEFVATELGEIGTGLPCTLFALLGLILLILLIGLTLIGCDDLLLRRGRLCDRLSCGDLSLLSLRCLYGLGGLGLSGRLCLCSGDGLLLLVLGSGIHVCGIQVHGSNIR